MHGIFFQPWRGEKYGRKSPFGVPVLIVGESHYGRNANPDWTIGVIEGVISGRRKERFFTNIAAAFLGAIPDESQRSDFWHSVAFYNYIQTSVGRDAKRRPTQKMWTEAESPFCKVLDQLKPRLVAIFGYATWENTPCSGCDAAPISSKGKEIPCYWFFVSDTEKTALAPKLKHASRFFRAQEWHPVILTALKRVGGHEWRD